MEPKHITFSLKAWKAIGLDWVEDFAGLASNSGPLLAPRPGHEESPILSSVPKTMWFVEGKEVGVGVGGVAGHS